MDSQLSEGLSLATVEVSDTANRDENHNADHTDEIDNNPTDTALENDESRPQADRESGFSPDFTSFASDVSISNGLAAPLTPIAEAECAIISSIDDGERLSAESAYGNSKSYIHITKFNRLEQCFSTFLTSLAGESSKMIIYTKFNYDKCMQLRCNRNFVYCCLFRIISGVLKVWVTKGIILGRDRTRAIFLICIYYLLNYRFARCPVDSS